MNFLFKTPNIKQSEQKTDSDTFRIWTNLDAVILSGKNLSDQMLSCFPDGKTIHDFIDKSFIYNLNHAVSSIISGSLLEITEISIAGKPYHLAITPDKNSKKIIDLVFTFTPVKSLTEKNRFADTLPLDLYDCLIDNPNIWIDVFSLPQCELILWNKGAEFISGYSINSNKNSCLIWGWLYPETDYRHIIWKNLNAKLKDTGFCEFTTRIRCCDKSEKVIGWTSRYLLDNQNTPIAIVNMGFDLTRETDYRIAMVAREEEFKTLAESSPDLIARFNRQYKCTFTNASTAAFNPFGITRNLMGNTISESLAKSENTKKLENYLKEIFLNRQMRSFEIETRTNFGESVFEIHLVPEISTDEIIRSVLVISRDITMRRRIEMRVRTAERFEAAGRVACELTHNINNRLTVLNGKLEILRRRLEKNEDVNPLIDDLLEVSSETSMEIRNRLTLGQSMENHEIIDVNLLLEKVIDNIKPTTRDTIKFESFLSPQKILVSGSPHHLENVFLNIVINARDAIKEKGVLNFSTQKTYIADKNRHIRQRYRYS